MEYNYSMHGKDPQSKAIVRQREEYDRKLREKAEKKTKESNLPETKPFHETDYCKI